MPRRRLPLAIIVAGLLVAACAPRRSTSPTPIVQSTQGNSEALGRGVTVVALDKITLELTAPAYVTVIRVFPHEAAELAETTDRALPVGAATVRLAVERSRVLAPAPPQISSTSGAQSSNGPVSDPSCLMQRARRASETWRDSIVARWRPNATQNPCQYTRAPRYVQSGTESSSPQRWTWGAPVDPGEHYLVVIASEGPLDATELSRELDELDISMVEGAPAAQAIPGYLMNARALRWAAWIVAPHQ